jgi:hypothetical protein
MSIGRTISPEEGDRMIAEYLNYIKSPVDIGTQTQSVSFSSKELMEWLNQIMPRADELRVCFGRYPAGHAQAGRMTVILWPYKDGEPTWTNPKDRPYNDGTGQP